MSAPVPSIRILGVIRKSGESQLQIDNFKWHLPLIYTHCLETIWNVLEKIRAFSYTSSHSQNVSKLLTEKLPKYSKPRSFRGDFAPRGSLQGLCPDPLETLSGPQTPRRLSYPQTQNPGSAPGYYWPLPLLKYRKRPSIVCNVAYLNLKNNKSIIACPYNLFLFCFVLVPFLFTSRRQISIISPFYKQKN